MLIWAESFDYYGVSDASRTNMLKGLWASFVGGSSLYVSTDQARTGTHSLTLTAASSIGSLYEARRVLGSSKTVLGVCWAMFFTSLPGVAGATGMCFKTAGNTHIASVRVNSDGSVSAYSGSSTIIATSDPVITASAWQHLEAKIIVDDVVGEIEIRVNGIVVLHATDIDFGATACSQVSFQHFETSPGYPASSRVYYDDIVVWDDTGSFNNDFLGPQRVLTIYAAADEATQDFTPTGAATGYECIDDAAPDDDSTYISSADIGDVSEFSMPTLPPETANISGVFIPGYAKLSDAGTGNLQISLVSNSEVAAGADNVLTAAYTYRLDLFETDPDTDVLWTKEGFEAAILHLEKTG